MSRLTFTFERDFKFWFAKTTKKSKNIGKSYVLYTN